MSTPTARKVIKSVVPSVEIEIDGRAIMLHYTFAALHEANANPFDGSIQKLLTSGLTPEAGAKFLLCGMSEQDRAAFLEDPKKLVNSLGPNVAIEVIGAVAQQIDETMSASGLADKGDSARPPGA